VLSLVLVFVSITGVVSVFSEVSLLSVRVSMVGELETVVLGAAKGVSSGGVSIVREPNKLIPVLVALKFFIFRLVG